jgi:hypothetical protein
MFILYNQTKSRSAADGTQIKIVFFLQLQQNLNMETINNIAFLVHEIIKRLYKKKKGEACHR